MRTVVALFLLMAVLAAPACGEGEETLQPTPASPSPTGSPVSPTAAGTPGPPTFVPPSPVGTVEATVPVGKIAFMSRRDGKGEIYLLTPEGEVNLTNNPVEDRDPDISPDGSKIVFASDLDGSSHIYVADIDGSNAIRLTNQSAGDFTPEWSPDGERIAFTRTGAVMVMDSDGSNVQQLTEPEPERTAAPCKAGAFLGGWSPDGERLTFYAASVTRGVGQICTIKVDGSDLRVVASEPPGYHVEPSWSPDGEWIAYRFIHEGNHEIYIVKPDGTSATNLTNNPATDLEPDWSVDGQWIVFGSDRIGNFDLYIMRPDGSELARITNSGAKDSDPSWGW